MDSKIKRIKLPCNTVLSLGMIYSENFDEAILALGQFKVSIPLSEKDKLLWRNAYVSKVSKASKVSLGFGKKRAYFFRLDRDKKQIYS